MKTPETNLMIRKQLEVVNEYESNEITYEVMSIVENTNDMNVAIRQREGVNRCFWAYSIQT